MVNCPGCGAENSNDALNCVACNRTLLVTCPVCGRHNVVSATTCAQCGRILDDTVDPMLIDKKLGDPVSEMFMPISRHHSEKPPRKAVIMLVLGLFVFAFIYLSKICEGHPLLLLVGGLISGVVALAGLIELTFWFIDDKGLSDSSFKQDKLVNDFPEIESSEITSPVASLEETDKDIVNSTKASEKITGLEMGTPLELAPEVVIKSATADKHYDTLAEFLEDGVASEIAEIKEKLVKTPDNYALMLRLAQLYEEHGEVDNAIENLEACVKHEPDSAEIYLYYGTLLRQKGCLDDAQMAFEKALNKNMFMSKAFYQLGLLEKTRGNLEQAKILMQKSIQLSPDDPYAHYQLGMTYQELGNTELAIMEVKRATVLHPTDSYGHSRLGQFYQKLNKHDLAISSFSRALGLKPKDSFVLEKLAEVLAAKGDHERAIDIFQEALASQFHQQPATMLSLAKSLKALERWDDLYDISREILRFDEKNYEAAFLMSYATKKQGKTTEAINLFEGLVHNTNAGYEAWYELGALYQSAGMSDKAIVAFTKAATGSPDQAGIWNTIGILLSNQKLYVDALRALKKAASYDYTNQSIADNLKMVQKKVENDAARIIEQRKQKIEETPDDIDAYLEMGKAYESVDMTQEALMAYQRVLSIDPKFVPGLMVYAELLRKLGKLKMAMRCYREIIKLEPNNLDAHLFMINANLNLGFINEANKHATIAEKLAKEDDMRVHFLLGKIYFAKGLAPRALKEFTKVTDSVGDPELISWAELMRKRLSRSNK